MKLFRKTLFILFFCMCLSSCVKTYKSVGYSFDEEKLSQIQANQTKINIVRNLLGSPSAKSKFGDLTWFYVSTEYQSIAFLNPKIKSQQILAIEFKDDVVSSIKKYDSSDAKKIAFSKDKTRTGGQKLGTLEQLLGNVGKFSTDSL